MKFILKFVKIVLKLLKPLLKLGFFNGLLGELVSKLEEQYGTEMI